MVLGPSYSGWGYGRGAIVSRRGLSRRSRREAHAAHRHRRPERVVEPPDERSGLPGRGLRGGRNGARLLDRAAERVRRTHPDVVLVDLFMPPLGGVAPIAAINYAVPGTRVFVLVGEAREATLQAAYAAGALGFVTKDGSVQHVPPDLGWSGAGPASPGSPPCGRPQAPPASTTIGSRPPARTPAHLGPSPLPGRCDRSQPGRSVEDAILGVRHESCYRTWSGSDGSSPPPRSSASAICARRC